MCWDEGCAEYRYLSHEQIFLSRDEGKADLACLIHSEGRIMIDAASFKERDAHSASFIIVGSWKEVNVAVKKQ